MNPFKNKIEELQRLKQYSQKKYPAVPVLSGEGFQCKYCSHTSSQSHFQQSYYICDHCHNYYAMPAR